MLINWHDPDHVYLVCGKTDLRKGIDGLAMVIAENYGLELYDNSLFLFCGSSPKCWCKLNSANLSFHKLKHTGF
ncbi:IS66 family insertion sequence element accessory protein TnpB, partial [Limosilactobacillus fermentum]